MCILYILLSKMISDNIHQLVFCVINKYTVHIATHVVNIRSVFALEKAYCFDFEKKHAHSTKNL